MRYGSLGGFHIGTFQQYRFIHSRRLEVGLGGFFEQGIVYTANISRATNSVKWIFPLPTCQIYNAAKWRDTVCWGYLGTAKNEGIVRTLEKGHSIADILWIS